MRKLMRISGFSTSVVRCSSMIYMMFNNDIPYKIYMKNSATFY